jgi:hypothetical protein
MQRHSLALSLMLSLSTFGCSDSGDGGDDGGGATGGSATGGTSTGGTGTGGSSTGGSSTGGSSTGGSSTGGSGGSGMSGGSGGSSTGGAGGSGGAVMGRGACEHRATAMVTTDSYMGTEEFFILTQEAVEDGRVDQARPEDMVCRIRFDVTRTGMAPAGCNDGEGVDCPWTHQVTYSNPQVLVDTSCANSEIGWDQAWVDEMDGSTVSYGYLFMYQNHGSVVFKYNDDDMEWFEFGGAYWNEETGEFTFRVPVGACRY